MNAEIEERICMEIVVDCYESEEAAMGWYYYLENYIKFPFQAIDNKRQSKLTITGLADSSECCEHMYVLVDFDGDDELLFPLENVTPLNVGDKTTQAIGDWQYWLKAGYHF